MEKFSELLKEGVIDPTIERVTIDKDSDARLAIKRDKGGVSINFTTDYFRCGGMKNGEIINSFKKFFGDLNIDFRG